jgi:hypothetical protein
MSVRAALKGARNGRSGLVAQSTKSFDQANDALLHECGFTMPQTPD